MNVHAKARAERKSGPLKDYAAKRDFSATPEPEAGVTRRKRAAASFVVQKHWASHLHYDFRLELDGVLVSWAVPKGPSLDPTIKRMAVHVEDHPLDYGAFEGDIPAGHYGAGHVIVWDRGTWQPEESDPRAALKAGKLAFTLDGDKLTGTWELIRTGPPAAKQERWLLFKKRDAAARSQADYDVTVALPDSVMGKKSRVKSPPKTKPAARQAPAVRVTHAERVIDKTSGLTKLDLVRYYEAVAERMQPHLHDRPLALLRAPAGVAGTHFFQKHEGGRGTLGLASTDVKGEDEPLLHAPGKDIAAALAQAAQMNVIEFHTWNATLRRIEHPDRLVFDLDPGARVGWPQVQEAAQLVQALLQELKLDSWLKTSGGKGLHLVVPFAGRVDHGTARALSHAVVLHLAQTLPDRFATRSGPKNRIGRIFVDYLRNGRGATTVAAFSARARPGLGVSMPVAWGELPKLEGGDHFSVATAAEHLAGQRTDPWADFWTSRQRLTTALRLMGVTPAKR